MAQKYTTILFDFDGCIADTLPIWLVSFRKTFDKLGIEVSDRDIIDKAFHMWNKTSDIVIPDQLLFDQKLIENFETQSSKMELHDGFIDSVQSLRNRGLKTAIVTSTLRKTIDAKLDQLQIADLFDTTLAWEDTDMNKPHPHPIVEAMKRLESIPEETIMIGDNEVDILAGKRAGVTSIWFYPPANHIYYPNNMFSHLSPDHTIGHFDELVTITM